MINNMIAFLIVTLTPQRKPLFNHVLDTYGLKLDQDGQPRTTYSLRHYALQTRLNKSDGKMNIYDLA